MAISITQRPERFTPSFNLINYVITSDNPNIYYFNVNIYDGSNSSFIATTTGWVFPDMPQGTQLNLQKILNNTVTWEIDNSNTISLGYTKPVQSYYLSIQEVMTTGATGVAINDSTSYTYYSDLDRISFNNYDDTKYVITGSTSVPVKFLTRKPDNAKVNDLSFEQLYYLNNGVNNLRLVIDLYDGTGSYSTVTQGLTYSSSTKMYKVNICPRVLQDTLNIDMTDVNYYKVSLDRGGTSSKVTETRTYLYNHICSNRDVINVIWTNELGGIDSYQFYNLKTKLDYTETSYIKNIYSLTNGVYSDRVGDILNPSDVIIDKSEQGTYTVNSDFLSDAESLWLRELYSSKQPFMEMTDLSIVPIKTVQNSYVPDRQKYNRQNPLYIDYQFQMSGGVVPNNEGWYNRRLSATFSKDDCSIGEFGTVVTYTVPAKTYKSYISQEDANEMAINEINSNGQQLANDEGTCYTTTTTLYPDPDFGTIVRNLSASASTLYYELIGSQSSIAYIGFTQSFVTPVGSISFAGGEQRDDIFYFKIENPRIVGLTYSVEYSVNAGTTYSTVIGPTFLPSGENDVYPNLSMIRGTYSDYMRINVLYDNGDNGETTTTTTTTTTTSTTTTTTTTTTTPYPNYNSVTNNRTNPAWSMVSTQLTVYSSGGSLLYTTNLGTINVGDTVGFTMSDYSDCHIYITHFGETFKNYETATCVTNMAVMGDWVIIIGEPNPAFGDRMEIAGFSYFDKDFDIMGGVNISIS